VGDDAAHFLLRLADAHTTDRITRQIERCQRLQRLFAQGLVHAALHDAEEGVRVL
jgi:hypothetical protein